MEAKNMSVSIIVPQCNISEKRDEMPRFYGIPPQESRVSSGKSSKFVEDTPANIPTKPRKTRRVYRHLCPKSSKTLSRCGSSENISALLGFLRKKRQPGDQAGRPARRRRSFPKRTKRSSKRSRKSPRQDKRSEHASKADNMLARMPVPQSV